MVEEVLAKDLFQTLDSNRSATLDRAELCAKVTIPYLFMEEGSSAQDDLTRGYAQGYGAKLVNHLTGKFVLSILPPSQSFYRLDARREAVQALGGEDEKIKQEIEKITAIIEEDVMRYINKSKFRASLYPAVRLAMVTGESLIEKVSDERFRVIGLRNYAVKRDGAGNILHLVIKEMLDYDALPDSIGIDEKDDNAQVELYTHIYLEEGKYSIYQEVEGQRFNEGNIKKVSDRFIFVRWNIVDGEDYARSFVEEHLGSFISLEKQSKVLNESAVVASKTVFTVNPNGFTKLKDYVNAKNGDVIVGSETDIGTIKVQKHTDLQLTYSLINDIKRELAEAFLLGSASIRDAERVTAHEVQMIASELEASFGGIYTSIANDIQLPLIENAIDGLKIDGAEDLDIVITTGVEALGRNVEMSKINRLIQDLGQLAMLIGQDKVAGTLNPQALVNAMIVNSGVGGKNFAYSLLEQEANSRAEQEAMLAQQFAGAGASQAGVNMANAGVPVQ